MSSKRPRLHDQPNNEVNIEFPSEVTNPRGVSKKPTLAGKLVAVFLAIFVVVGFFLAALIGGLENFG